jgi:hypothetical protein
MKKGISLPIESVIILALAVIAMIVFLLFYFGAFGLSIETVEDIEGEVKNPLFGQADEGLKDLTEDINTFWSNGAFK